MQKTLLSLAMGMSLLLTLSACQPKLAAAPDVEAKDSTDQIRQSSVEKPPKPTTNNSAVDAKTCLALSDAMKK